jgi:hypothetical protein
LRKDIAVNNFRAARTVKPAPPPFKRMSESKHRKRFDLAVGIIGILGFVVSSLGLWVTMKTKHQVVTLRDTITVIQKDIRVIRDTIFIHGENTRQPDDPKPFVETEDKDTRTSFERFRDSVQNNFDDFKKENNDRFEEFRNGNRR